MIGHTVANGLKGAGLPYMLPWRWTEVVVTTNDTTNKCQNANIIGDNLIHNKWVVLHTEEYMYSLFGMDVVSKRHNYKVFLWYINIVLENQPNMHTCAWHRSLKVAG